MLHLLYLFGYLAMITETIIILVWSMQELSKKTCDHSNHAEGGLVGASIIAIAGLLFVVAGFVHEMITKETTGKTTTSKQLDSGQVNVLNNNRPTFGGPLLVSMHFTLAAVWLGATMAGPGILSNANPGCGAGYADPSETGYDYKDIMHVLLLGTLINAVVAAVMMFYAICTATMHPTQKAEGLTIPKQVALIVHDTLATTFDLWFLRSSTATTTMTDKTGTTVFG